MEQLEQIKEECETLAFRLNCLQEEISMKVKEGETMYKRKIELLELIIRLENEKLGD